MSFAPRVPVVYGGGGIGAPDTFCKLTTVEAAQEVYDAWCRITGPSGIDTSAIYGLGTSEVLISKMNLHGSFVDTKCYPISPGAHSYDNIKKAVNESVKKLEGIQIRVFYLHAPDRTVAFKETLRAINELHGEGKFEQFGLSNFRSYEVAEIVTIARANGWIQPTVYEGVYSPIDRVVETELLPCLQRYNIKFAAYSPLAGGLLVGHQFSGAEPKIVVEDNSHWDTRLPFGAFFSSRYGHVLPAVHELKKFVDTKGINLNQASVRWLQHHGALTPNHDFIIFGGSKASHVEQTLKYCLEGPLPGDVVEAFERCYKAIKADIPNYHHDPAWYKPEVHGV
ncbi:aflatoxin B1-aldehyde reductase [Coprinopsis marcescibilis]|uniref:Aflatoxin B1-aldehyde reductase n=1 Tax=Coprinopsis marcescibilis TaxID=230819 RepID=A0A5C3LLP6_COPMA|nr:aflatoxin B1-aldehyde reductase [Coprinopsis marcescibilis]